MKPETLAKRHAQLPYPSAGRASQIFAALLAMAVLSACQTLRPQPPILTPPTRATEATITPPRADPPAKPGTRLETGPAIRPAATTTLARLRQKLQVPHCTNQADASAWLTHYASPRAHLAERLSEVLPLLDFVERQLSANGLPVEFAMMPLIESNYRADAIGPGGAAGLWQFMAATARAHGAVINASGDTRFSVLESTVAATSYLKALQQRFGDWRIAVMAFNAGEARIARALTSSGPGTPASVDRARLPKVTRNYVARLEALRCLIAEPQRHALALPENGPAEILVEIALPPTAYSLRAIATALGISERRLLQLNGGLKQPYFPQRERRRMLVPQPSQEALAALADVRETAPAVAMHLVRSGDSLWSIAHRYQLRVSELQQFNRLKPDAILQPGQSLRLRP